MGEDMGRQALPVLVRRACSLSVSHRGTGLQVRAAQSKRKSWSPFVCCISDRPARAGRTRMHIWSPSKQQRIDTGTSTMPSIRWCSPTGAMAIAAALLRTLVAMCALCQCRYAMDFTASTYAYGTCSASYMQAVRARLDGGTAHEGNALHRKGRLMIQIQLQLGIAWHSYTRGHFRYKKKQQDAGDIIQRGVECRF